MSSDSLDSPAKSGLVPETDAKSAALPAAGKLAVSAAALAGADAKALGLASTALDTATVLQRGSGMGALATGLTGLAGQANPQLGQALQVASQLQGLAQQGASLASHAPQVAALTQEAPQALAEEAAPALENLVIAEHPLAGQAVSDFAVAEAPFVPPAIDPAQQGDVVAAALARFSDGRRLLRFYSPLAGDQALLIESLSGTAAISEQFAFHLSLISENAEIDLKDMMGKNVSVSVQLADGSEHFVNGYVHSFGFTHSDGGFAFYHAQIVPWLSYLKQRVNSRIFQDQTVLEVLDTVFKTDYNGLANYELRTGQTYQPQNFIVQYDETDEHFVSRLMERYGLFYYFEHKPNGHVMVISDDSRSASFCPPQEDHAEIEFNGGNRWHDQDSVTAFAAERKLQSTKVALNTFDFKSPNTLQYVEVPTVTQQGDMPTMELYDGNPAFSYKDKEHGQREARQRMEVLEWQAKVFTGASDCRGLVAGHTFKLTGHHWFDPTGDGDNDFLVLSVQYTARNNYFERGQGDVYQNTFTAIRRKIPFRPRRVHALPRMPGPQTATVVGPKGTEIHTDKFGRIKVQFHWDRYGRRDERSSCWIRVSQPWAGKGWGTISIPRIVLVGLIAIPRLAVERYPNVAPPSVSISATYPGASAATMNDAVVGPIERELSSVKNMLYFESSTDATGSAQITATFRPGVDPELAQVDVQNRLKAVEPRLPQAVRQNGLGVESAVSNVLMFIGLTSPDGSRDETDLSDYMARNLVEELRRVPGVGKVQLYGAEKAMRVWVDPAKLVAYKVSMADVTAAIARQNAQIAPGRIGDAPAPSGQQINVPLTVQGQLTTPAQFARIVLRANRNGSSVVLGDVARVELGAQSYGFATRENGHPSTSAAVQLAPGANAVATAAAVRTRLGELQKALPHGIALTIPFDTAPFVKVSIEKVVHTLVEAMVLVFLVMYLFLQNVRYTLIPALVAPIALLGTFTVMMLAGFSINVLTMFGMVLAIGIIVDDAIVVVENVERLMAQEGLGPKEATAKAMREITGAVVGITLVLTAVFIPMAFAGGSVGVIYRQFAVAMSVSILFSAFLALSFTPALCATLLKPVAHDHHARGGFFGWFNGAFERATGRYAALTRACIARPLRVMLAWGAVAAVLAFGFRVLPSAFLPDEDQGYFITSFQLPSDATAERTLQVVKAYERHVASRPGIDTNESVLGFGFAGTGPNAAMAYTTLKDWDKRAGSTAQDEVAQAQAAMDASREGVVMSVMPPAIDGLGNSSGFALRLQDRANLGHAALVAAERQLLALAAQSDIVTGVYSEGLPPGTSVRLDIDRAKAETLGITFADISDTLSAALGSTYVNDFPNAGRMQQVIVQADAHARMQVDDVLRLNVKNAAGAMVPLAEVVRPVWSEAPLQMVRYQGYPSVRIAGSTAPGASSGAAMAEMERLAAQLPPGFAVEWTGQSLEERDSAAAAPLLMALSMVVVFLVLAALYESWSIPVSVLLVVPLGLVGALAAVMLRGLPNDVFFKVGMITVIGLSAKNAILIVEFAKQFHDDGMPRTRAAIEAARLRLRPIVMTSLAFGLGVVPLVVASGASSETQHAIGTGVLGGMVTATVLAVFFVPVFFVVVTGLQARAARFLGRRTGDHPAPARVEDAVDG